MPTKLVSISIPSDNLERSVKFYSALLGHDLARSLTDVMVSYHSPISAGVMLTVQPRKAPGEPAIFLAVDDLAKELDQVTRLGGSVVIRPMALPVATAGRAHLESKLREHGSNEELSTSVGTMAIIKDPDGNFVGLLQLSLWAQHMYKRGDLTDADLQEFNVAREISKQVMR